MTRILVTDDQVDILLLMELALNHHGYEVVTARDGRQALEITQTQHFDLILLDLMMPEMNGFDTLKILRVRANSAQIPIIAVTARAIRGDEEQLINAGFDWYLLKPFMVDQLIDVVEKYQKTPHT